MKSISFLSILYLASDVYGANANPRIDPVVQISQGSVQGRQATDGAYSYFLGIPYGQVDLDNPFGPAQPPPDFDDVFNAYEGSIRCPQTFIRPYAPIELRNDLELETLDCLRLNIYVPNEANSSNPLPVLVWIHGGVFAFGYAGEHNPRDLVNHGIIVVTINYRLGPYGFMCLDVPSVPGNQGLKDQYEALRWIRNNIAAFGGNPYDVTLAGQSAGSGSTVLHLYSSKDKLYDKVIAQSGTPLNPGMFTKRDVDAALKLAEYLGLNTTDTEQALDFLAHTPHNLVTNAARQLFLILRPCQERSFSGVVNFVETDPLSLTNERKIRNTPILVGHTSKEHFGALNMYGDNYWLIDPFYIKLRDNFNLNKDTLVEVAGIVRRFYIGDEPISRDLTSTLEEFDSDFMFHHPKRRTITNLINENANPVYQYVFSYVGDSGATGARHSAELRFLFEMTNRNTIANEEEQLISDRIIALWANFVKFGNPTPSVTDLLPVIWEPATTNTRPYLVIDTDMRLEHFVNKERTSLWDLFYSVYGRYGILAPEFNNSSTRPWPNVIIIILFSFVSIRAVFTQIGAQGI